MCMTQPRPVRRPELSWTVRQGRQGVSLNYPQLTRTVVWLRRLYHRLWSLEWDLYLPSCVHPSMDSCVNGGSDKSSCTLQLAEQLTVRAATTHWPVARWGQSGTKTPAMNTIFRNRELTYDRDIMEHIQVTLFWYYQYGKYMETRLIYQQLVWESYWSGLRN